MATFDSLLIAKKIIRVTVPLGRGQFHDRSLYAYPDCLQWMRDEVPNLQTGRLKCDQTPLEQLDGILRQWMSGDPMRYGRMFQDLMPASDEVWEMKTPDLRMFGWMYQPRKFIAVFGDFADDYKAPTKKKTYAAAREAVVKARAALDLDGVKFVTGDFDELV